MPDPGRLETQKVVTLCGYWESNPGLLIEQPAVSTPKPSLQPQTIVMRYTRRLSRQSSSCLGQSYSAGSSVVLKHLGDL